MKSKFVYRLELIVYERADLFLPLLLRDKNIRHYLAITHDKDRYEDGENKGELKKLHSHVYLSLYAQRSFKGLACDYSLYLSPLGIKVLPENMRCIETDFHECVDYALHKYVHNEFKHLYDIRDFYSDNFSFFKRDESVNNTAYAIVRDLEDGNTMRSMARKFGRDYILHYQDYKFFVSEMKMQEEQLIYRKPIFQTVLEPVPLVLEPVEPVQQSIDDIDD